MNPADLRAVFLTGEKVYIRAYVEDDKEVAAAWAGSAFPVGSIAGARLLEDWHKEYRPRARRYALCRTGSDEIVGGVVVHIRNLIAEFRIAMAPWLDDADALRAAALELLVPWLSEEWTMVSVTVQIASDHSETIAAAGRLGMIHAGTMREFHARPGGERADDLYYQKLRSMEARADA